MLTQQFDQGLHCFLLFCSDLSVPIIRIFMMKFTKVITVISNMWHLHYCGLACENKFVIQETEICKKFAFNVEN